MREIEKKSFVGRIRVDKECNTTDIVRKLKNNEISIHSLNETQKEKVYLFLKNQVLSKRSRLTIKKTEYYAIKLIICVKKRRM